MTKKDIVRILAERYGLTQLETKVVVQGTLDAIVKALLKEGKIELRNFGVFKVKTRRARRARNPRNGGNVEVPAKDVVAFKPGRLMEQLIDVDNHPESAHLTLFDFSRLGDGVPTPTRVAPAGGGSSALRPRIVRD